MDHITRTDRLQPLAWEVESAVKEALMERVQIELSTFKWKIILMLCVFLQIEITITIWVIGYFLPAGRH
jgi:hypothetical protein